MGKLKSEERGNREMNDWLTATGKPYDRLVRTYTGDGRVLDNSVEVYARYLGGYYADGKYYWYVTDYQGNNAGVICTDGQMIQKTEYYPYGELWREPEGQPWLCGANERLRMDGVNEYDFREGKGVRPA